MAANVEAGTGWCCEPPECYCHILNWVGETVTVARSTHSLLVVNHIQTKQTLQAHLMSRFLESASFVSESNFHLVRKGASRSLLSA